MNPNERDFDGATPLHYAASQGHCGVVDWMLKEGGARIILDNLGGSPLHTAAEFGNNKVSGLRCTAVWVYSLHRLSSERVILQSSCVFSNL